MLDVYISATLALESAKLVRSNCVHAWYHLEHFFSSLLSSKDFWVAILGILGALVGAVVGGLLTIVASIRAQKQAARDQRIRDREIEREAIRGTLEAIATEIEIFKVKYLDAFALVFRPQTHARVYQ